MSDTAQPAALAVTGCRRGRPGGISISIIANIPYWGKNLPAAFRPSSGPSSPLVDASLAFMYIKTQKTALHKISFQ
jgi:hypothetical protein